ncbi:MAG: hypothetical protein EU541_03515 [Promethearchaeota archaeon]|nr:MAG: hypothetical protein EU541_03515 [Candidatus Lokiarchaeota archaeon]
MSNSLNFEEESNKADKNQRLSDIGKKAQALDEKSIKERMKIDKRTGIRIIVAFIFYTIIMILFYFFL